MKKVKILHLISFIFIAVFILAMVATGWYGLPVYSFSYLKHGVGDLLRGRFATGSVSQLVAGILFIVASVAIIVLIVLLIVRAVKRNKKQYLAVSLVTLILTWILLGAFYVIYTASVGWNGTSVINANLKNAFVNLFDPTSGTVEHLRASFTILMIILVVAFFVMQIVAVFKELKLIESDEVEEAEVEVLTEDEMREIIREELVAFYSAHPVAAPAPAAEPEVIVAPVEEPTVVEEPVVEEVFERQEATAVVDANNNGRISFYERIVALDQELLDDYNELKNELISYGLKSRVSSTGDTFRLHRVTYCKMIFSGKKVKLFLKLNPADYKDSTIPFDDISHKKSYAEIPFVFKVKSGLSLRRAKALIKEMMDNNGIIQESEPKKVKYAEMLIKDIKEGNVEL